MISFDLALLKKTDDPASFSLAAENKRILSLGFLESADEPFAGRLSIPSTGASEKVLCFFPFPYEGNIWDLTEPDEFSALSSRLNRDGKDLFQTYRALCKEAIVSTDCRFAFGLEAFRRALGERSDSPAYRKTMLDLTDCLVRKKLILGFAAKDSHFSLSPCVLRRFAELRGDLLPASFARTPNELGKGAEDALLLARAAGVGSYITYQNAEWERRSVATYKESL